MTSYLEVSSNDAKNTLKIVKKFASGNRVQIEGCGSVFEISVKTSSGLISLVVYGEDVDVLSARKVSVNQYASLIYKQVFQEKHIIGTRYSKECMQVSALASERLNHSKNRDKGDFEKLSLGEILDLLVSEVKEVNQAIFALHVSECESPDSKHDFTNAYDEIGDVAAVLAGLTAKINSMGRV